MENFPSNSHESKLKKAPELTVIDGEGESKEKSVPKVVKKGATKRKKTLTTRFVDMFFGEDSKSVVNYVVTEILIPEFRDLVANVITQGIERRIYGDARPVRRGRPSGSNGYVSYNRFSSPSSRRDFRSGDRDYRREESRTANNRSRGFHDFGEIVIDNSAEAHEVLDVFHELLDKYGLVTVSELYEMTGIEATYTDRKWGWTSHEGINLKRIVGGGYALIMPRPEPLDIN